jgi:hypothetical protein
VRCRPAVASTSLIDERGIISRIDNNASRLNVVLLPQCFGALPCEKLRFVEKHRRPVNAKSANDREKMIALNIQTQKPPMLTIDELPIDEIRLRIIASRHLRQ